MQRALAETRSNPASARTDTRSCSFALVRPGCSTGCRAPVRRRSRCRSRADTRDGVRAPATSTAIAVAATSAPAAAACAHASLPVATDPPRGGRRGQPQQCGGDDPRPVCTLLHPSRAATRSRAPASRRRRQHRAVQVVGGCAARNTAAPARSAGSPQRPAGMRSRDRLVRARRTQRGGVAGGEVTGGDGIDVEPFAAHRGQRRVSPAGPMLRCTTPP